MIDRLRGPSDWLQIATDRFVPTAREVEEERATRWDP